MRRIAKGMTGSDLAKMVGITRSYLSAIERGARQGAPKTLVRIAAELDLSEDELLAEVSSTPAIAA